MLDDDDGCFSISPATPPVADPVCSCWLLVWLPIRSALNAKRPAFWLAFKISIYLKGLYATREVRQKREEKIPSSRPGDRLAKNILSVLIDARRRGHRRKINQVLSGMFVALHIARGCGKQLFTGLAVNRETRDAGADCDVHGFACAHRKLVFSNRFSNSLSYRFRHPV